MNSFMRTPPAVAAIRCAGDGCTSDPGTWPLFHVQLRGVLCRLCSSCVLLSYRSAYCCCCFFLLGRDPPAHFEDADPLIAPHAPTATCHVCNTAVAHLSCLHSACDVFVCPACSAATAGRPFSYAPPCRTPLDVRGTRVLVLAARMALSWLRRDAANLRAVGERLCQESVAARKEAYRELGLAMGVDPTLPSTFEDVPATSSSAPTALEPPPVNPAPEGNGASMHLALDLNETPPSTPLPAAPSTTGAGGVRETSMACAEVSTSSPPPLRTLQLLWKDEDDEA